MQHAVKFEEEARVVNLVECFDQIEKCDGQQRWCALMTVNGAVNMMEEVK